MKIVCVSFPSWQGDYVKSTVKIISKLSISHEVLFVDYPFTWKDLAETLARKKKIPIKEILGLRNRLRTVETEYKSKISLLSLPPIIPNNWINNDLLYFAVLKLNSFITTIYIKRAINKLNYKNFVHFNAFNPYLGINLLRKIKAYANIYYCYDNIESANWVGKHGKRLEELFMPKVDAIITTSLPLAESKSKFNKNTFVVENGVDIELFNLNYNDALANKETKIIGYVGSIDDRLDFDLIEAALTGFSDTQFKFIGRIVSTKEVKALSKYPNVEFIGPMEYKGLPIKIQQMTIGIIPFKKNSFTMNIYPLKINEYLAVGIQVLSTNFTNLEQFNSFIEIADNNQIFLDKMKGLLDTKQSESAFTRRKEFARSNSWDSRSSRIEDIINAVIGNKKI